MLCSTEDAGLQSLHAGDVEYHLLEDEAPRSDDMRRASEVAAREPQLQGANALTVSPEHVADTRRRARFRSNGSEASFRGRARFSARFGGKDNDACSRFGQLSIADPPTPSVHSDESPNDTAGVACPIIQTRVPRAGAPTLNAHSREDSTNADGWTDSQSSLAAAHAIELSLIEAAAATSDLEVDHIAQTLHEADGQTLVIAKQLSQADATFQRESDELNLATVLSRAEQIRQSERHTLEAEAEKNALEQAIAESRRTTASFDLSAFTDTASAAFAITGDADAAAKFMLEAGVATEDDFLAASDLADEADARVAQDLAENSSVIISAERCASLLAKLTG